MGNGSLRVPRAEGTWLFQAARCLDMFSREAWEKTTQKAQEAHGILHQVHQGTSTSISTVKAKDPWDGEAEERIDLKILSFCLKLGDFNMLFNGLFGF